MILRKKWDPESNEDRGQMKDKHTQHARQRWMTTMVLIRVSEKILHDSDSQSKESNLFMSKTEQSVT